MVNVDLAVLLVHAAETGYSKHKNDTSLPYEVVVACGVLLVSNC